jgi:Rrf2 family protein
MKLTGSVSYAIGILLQVATAANESPMTAAKIARGCRFPPRFLYRILRRLVDAGLLDGTSGPGGGYRLAKAPASLTLLDVVAAVDAPPEPSRLRPVKASHQKALDGVNKLCAVSAARFARDLRRMKLSSLIEAQSAKTKPARPKPKKRKTAKRRA